MNKYTIFDLQREFPDDASCLEYLVNLRWPDGIHCERCQRITKHHRMVKRMSYSCDRCGNHVHPMAGTVYEKSRTPLRLWFYATYLMASTRCGVSAKQIQRETGVSYKTAWRMFKQVRSLLEENGSLSGTIETDDTWIGGKRRYRKGEPHPLNKEGGLKRGRPKREDDNKTAVLGIVERGGSVKATVVPDLKSKTLFPIIREYVMPRSTVYTDEATYFRQMAGQGYKHRRVHHRAKIYVRGTVHTNTIEGFWSLLKRGIGGVYHSVSAKYLQSYLNEYSFRYNHRNDEPPMFKTMISRVAWCAAQDGTPS